MQRIVGEVGTAGGVLGLGVAKDRPKHRQTLAFHHGLAGETVPEIVNPYINETNGLAHPPGHAQVDFGEAVVEVGGRRDQLTGQVASSKNRRG